MNEIADRPLVADRRRGEDTRSGRNALLPATGGRADTLSLAYVDIIACQFRVTLLIA